MSLGGPLPHLHKFAVVLIVIGVAVGFLAPSARRTGRHIAQARTAAGVDTRSGSTKAHAAAPARKAPARRVPAFDRVKAAAAARAVAANELGQVPVLMIHRVMAKPEASLDRTPTELYEEFSGLAKQGYVPVTAAEFVTGHMNVPAGRHPVVLTFDDGSPTQVAFDAAGNPRPDTAVGVIERVARENPGFRPVATFFVNKDPFVNGGMAPAMALRWLVQHGFEVANHTTHHLDLARMSKGEVAKEIGGDEKMIHDATGRPSVTFAFPFGALSHLDWARHGDGGGAKYDFAGMFLAGWKPADPPYAKNFDARQIPRIRDEGKIKEDDCKQFCSTAWLEWLAKNPDQRYTSDGNPATVAFPQDKMISLAARYKGSACAY
jgi:peptidoglycan/xylan/chitin deacetylase (PgdA/CDA1 family)